MSANGENPYDRAAGAVSRFVADRVAAPPEQLANPTEPAFDALESVIWTIQRSVRSEVGYDREMAVVARFRELPRRMQDLRTYVTTWWDAIAVLVVEAERRHAGSSGQGAAKLAEVEARVAQAVDDGVAPFAALEWLDGQIVCEMTEWTVIALVTLANRYSLWGDGSSALREVGRARRAGMALRRALVRPPARALTALGRAFVFAGWYLRRLTLPRDERGAAGSWRRQHRAPDPATARELFGAVRELHAAREDVLGGLVLFTTAIEHAEREQGLTDAQASRYAVDLSLLALENVGIQAETDTGAQLLDASVALAVDVLRPFIARGSLVAA